MATSVETFEQLVLTGTAQQLVPWLLTLDKPALVSLRKPIRALKRDLTAVRMNTDRRGQVTYSGGISDQQQVMLALAGFAAFSKKEAFGREFELPWHFYSQKQGYSAVPQALLMQVLTHFRPDWFSDWLIRALSRSQGQMPGYWQLRELEQTGLLRYDAPVFAASLALFRLPNRLYLQDSLKEVEAVYAHLRQLLGTDETLLTRDLPLLFDYDTSVDSAYIWVGSDCPSTRWLGLLPQLVASGQLERGELLTRSLLALRRDFRRPLLTWFKDLFLALKPTPAECLARQGELTELLAHPLPQVVNFALDQLKSLWGQPGFAPALLLQHTDALLNRQDLKTGLRTLLGGFEKLLARDPGLAPALAPPLATAALVNPDMAVQERAAKLLAGLLGAKKPVLTAAEAAYLTDSLAMYADVLAPAARAALAPYLGAAATPAATEAAAEIATYAPLAEFVPDISEATAIAPVADWHELLFLTGAVLKHDDPGALERWIDGLLRLHGQFPDGYAQQLQPYLRQALPWLFQDKSEDESSQILRGYDFRTSFNSVGSLVPALLVSWFNGFARPLVPNLTLNDQIRSRFDPLLPLVQQRLAAAEAQLGTARPLPLLSTPTHAPHWVAPAALVHKLLAYEAAGQLPAPADLVVALARTAWRADTAAARALLPQVQQPDLRALLGWFLAPAAQSTSQPVAEPAAQPVLAESQPAKPSLLARLGGWLAPDKTPSAAPMPEAEALAKALPWLWAVAARTRHPEAVFDELRPLGKYPGVVEPWHPGWAVRPHSHTFKQPWNKEQPELTQTWQQLDVATEHPGQAPPSPLLLYSLHARLRQENQYYGFALEPDFLFLSALLPNHAAPLHWHLLRTACHRTPLGATGTTERDMLLKFLQTQLGPGPVFDEPVTVLLATCLTKSQAACRALATEVLLSAMDHRRLQPAVLGGALGRLLAAEYAPVQRLADALALARDMDPTNNDALAQLLEALLPALPTAPPLRNTRLLLDTYARARALAPRQLPAPVQTQLRTWSAAPSLKKAALALLA